MSIKYDVRLTDDKRAMLEALIKQEKPKVAQHKKRQAGILLAIDENQSPLTHEQVDKAYCVRPVTICRLRQRLVEEGLEAAVNGKPVDNSYKRKLDMVKGRLILSLLPVHLHRKAGVDGH